MHPLRLIVLGIAVSLIGLTLWAFMRLLGEVFMLAGRGLRTMFGGGCCGRSARYQHRGRPPVRIMSVGMPPRPPGRPEPIRCRNEKCQWENRPNARFCAHCGRSLSAAKDASVA